MERNDEFVSLSFLQAEFIQSDRIRVVLIETKHLFLLLKRIAIVARAVLTDGIGSDDTDSHVFPTAANLWRVSELYVVVHRLRYLVNGEGDVTSFINLQEAWPSPCSWTIRIVLSNDDSAILQ